MPVKRSKRVQLIVDLETNAEKQAANNLSGAQKVLAAEQQRLSEVQRYYQTYSKHFASQNSALTAVDLSRSREFLANLDTAIKAQSSQVKLAEQQVNTALEQWRKCHFKVKTLQSFQERCQAAESHEQDKLEQKLLDELAANTRRFAS